MPRSSRCTTWCRAVCYAVRDVRARDAAFRDRTANHARAGDRTSPRTAGTGERLPDRRMTTQPRPVVSVSPPLTPGDT